MPSWIPESIGLEGMLSALNAGTPTPTPSAAGSLPPGWQDPGSPSTPAGGGIDLSWLFGGGPTRGEQFGPAGRYGRPGTESGIDLGQLFGNAPQEQLAQAIAERMGLSLGATRNLYDAARQREVYNIAQRAQSDPTLRQQLATWMGWNMDNAHVQYWIQSGGGVPSNPTSKTAGPTTTPTGGTGTGVSGSGAPSSDPSQAKVQAPWASSIFNQPYSGNNYGDAKPPGVNWGGWTWHQGQDYGMPQGTALSFPFAGKVVRVGYDPSGYGNYVTVEFGNQGMTLTYAHLQYVQVKQGQTITPGQQVGLSGSTGISTGPHLLVVEQNARGQPIDPRPLIQAMFSGATLASLETAGVAQTGTLAPAGTTQGYIVTPDGVTLYDGTPDYGYYNMVNTAYEQRYGTQAPYSLVMAIKATGVQNTSQMAAVAANWPSDIIGMTFGQRDAVYNTANGIAMKNWNRPIPDSLVKRLAQAGLTTPDDIRTWFDGHLPTDIPPADYQQIYDAAMPAISSTYGEGPSPDYIGYLWGQTQAASSGTASTTPGTAQSISPNLPGQYVAPPQNASIPGLTK